MTEPVPEYLRVGEVAKALGVSVDTLRRWELDGRVTFERRQGQRVLAIEDLAPLLAADASGARHTSARNRLAGIVLRVDNDGVMAQVEMLCGEYRIVSLMTSESVKALGLAPGKRAAAVVKATNVIVEA